MKILQITYLDSSMTHEQTWEMADIAAMTTVGYLVKEDKDSITLAAELVKDEYRRQIAIPKVAIISRIELLSQSPKKEGI